MRRHCTILSVNLIKYCHVAHGFHHLLNNYKSNQVNLRHEPCHRRNTHSSVLIALSNAIAQRHYPSTANCIKLAPNCTNAVSATIQHSTKVRPVFSYLDPVFLLVSGNIEHHRSQHSDTPLFTCPKCNYRSASSRTLANHKRLKHYLAKDDERATDALLCNLATGHVLPDASEPAVKTFVCADCPYTAEKQSRLERHRKSVHSEERFSSSTFQDNCMVF